MRLRTFHKSIESTLPMPKDLLLSVKIPNEPKEIPCLGVERGLVPMWERP